MAVRTPSQLAWRRRVETGIRLVAPALDSVSRVAGRGDPEPEPPRRMSRPPEHAPLRNTAEPS
jgi:hypothetical protein